jgi:hypothetical protein
MATCLRGRRASWVCVKLQIASWHGSPANSYAFILAKRFCFARQRFVLNSVPNKLACRARAVRSEERPDSMDSIRTRNSLTGARDARGRPVRFGGGGAENRCRYPIKTRVHGAFFRPCRDSAEWMFATRAMNRRAIFWRPCGTMTRHTAGLEAEARTLAAAFRTARVHDRGESPFFGELVRIKRAPMAC